LIALDTSALVAILCLEPEAALFLELLLERKAVLGAPTALEFHMVMSSIGVPNASAAVDQLLASPAITVVEFSPVMLACARSAFDRFGKGRHHARLNYGDCLAYAVAKTHDAPLLFKGEDFLHTDISPACQPGT
jgi:ribonuclease VapC